MQNGIAIDRMSCASACKRRRRASKIICVSISGAKLPALSSARRARHLPSPTWGDTFEAALPPTLAERSKSATLTKE